MHTSGYSAASGTKSVIILSSVLFLSKNISLVFVNYTKVMLKAHHYEVFFVLCEFDNSFYLQL